MPVNETWLTLLSAPLRNSGTRKIYADYYLDGQAGHRLALAWENDAVALGADLLRRQGQGGKGPGTAFPGSPMISGAKSLYTVSSGFLTALLYFTAMCLV